MKGSGNLPNNKAKICKSTKHQNFYLNTEREMISNEKEKNLDQARVYAKRMTIEELFRYRKSDRPLGDKRKKMIKKFLIILAIVFSALILVTIILFCIKKKK